MPHSGLVRRLQNVVALTAWWVSELSAGRVVQCCVVVGVATALLQHRYNLPRSRSSGWPFQNDSPTTLSCTSRTTISLRFHFRFTPRGLARDAASSRALCFASATCVPDATASALPPDSLGAPPPAPALPAPLPAPGPVATWVSPPAGLDERDVWAASPSDPDDRRAALRAAAQAAASVLATAGSCDVG